MEAFLWLCLLGLFVGTIGTLIGAGGGFVLVPILLLAFPNEGPHWVASISLVIVCLNGLSGSLAYARMRRIDYLSSAVFGAFTIPGAILGARTTGTIPRGTFDLICGGLMMAVSIFLFIFPEKEGDRGPHLHLRGMRRVIVEADGTTHIFAYNPLIGIAISLAVGFFSSLVGMGGGIVHVPAMVHLMDFPVHIATATSHMVVAIAAMAGVMEHIRAGAYTHGVGRTLALAAGVLVGAQVGARLSQRLHGAWIIRSLALALALVGARLLLKSITG